MQYKIKLENDLVYDNIEADYADDALNIWLNNHKEYWLKNILSEENYKQLKIDVSSLDAKIQTMIEKANNKKIVVTSNLFKYLEKYNFEVISLDESETALYKNISTVKNMISKNFMWMFKENHNMNRLI